MTPASRARGALYGLAIGDALGMPTQMLSRPEIVARWGPMLSGFEPAPPGHPIAAGMPAGAVTDDTEQAVLLGRLLVAGHGTIDPHDLAGALVAWEHDMAERGSLDLLRPLHQTRRHRRPGGHTPGRSRRRRRHQRRRHAHRPRRRRVLPGPGLVRSGRPRRSGELRHAQHG